MKAFIDSQFNYCPLIWMFHSRTLSNKVNRLHERALRLKSFIAYSNFKSSFNELSQKYNSFTIHQINIQSLSTKIYQFLNGLSPGLMSNVFKQNQSTPYKLRNCNTFRSKRVNSVQYGTETLSYFGPKIWSIVPETIKNNKSLESFKWKWKNGNLNIHVGYVKTLLKHVGFIWSGTFLLFVLFSPSLLRFCISLILRLWKQRFVLSLW